MFTITGLVVSQSQLKKKDKTVYANEVQLMTSANDKKYLHGVKDFSLGRSFPEGQQITLAVQVKLNTFNNRSSLEIVALEDQSAIASMFKDSKAA